MSALEVLWAWNSLCSCTDPWAKRISQGSPFEPKGPRVVSLAHSVHPPFAALVPLAAPVQVFTTGRFFPAAWNCQWWGVLEEKSSL